jgi:hypothetical protein
MRVHWISHIRKAFFDSLEKPCAKKGWYVGSPRRADNHSSSVKALSLCVISKKCQCRRGGLPEGAGGTPGRVKKLAARYGGEAGLEQFVKRRYTEKQL